MLQVELEKLEEIKASEEVVKKIQEEEQELEEKLREDENIAKQLQKQELERVSITMVFLCRISRFLITAYPLLNQPIRNSNRGLVPVIRQCNFSLLSNKIL